VISRQHSPLRSGYDDLVLKDADYEGKVEMKPFAFVIVLAG